TRRDLSSVAAPWAEPSMLARFSLVTRGIHGSQSLRPFGLEHRRDEWRIQHGSFQREDEVVVARRHLDADATREVDAADGAARRNRGLEAVGIDPRRGGASGCVILELDGVERHPELLHADGEHAESLLAPGL